MNHREIKAMMTELAPVIRDYVGETVRPLVARIAELEARGPTQGEKGLDGREGRDGISVAGASLDDGGVLILRLSDGGEIKTGRVVGKDGEPGKDGLDGADGKDGEPGRDGNDGADGKDGEPGKDGDPGKDGVDGRDGQNGADGKDGSDGESGADGKDGADGRDADPTVIRQSVAAEIEKAIAAIPTPKDGIDGKDGRDGAGGKDGVGLAGALIDRDGGMVVTFSDGRTKDLGTVVGRDGKDGLDGHSGTDGKDGAPGRDGVDGIDGKDGERGADGFGFDHMEEELADDGRTIVRRYRRGDEVKEFRHTFAVVIDRGVYQAERAYESGDGVTYGGSFWIAQRSTTTKPESGEDWRLAIKRGRDGKSGKDGRDGERGKEGERGRDLTQMDAEGNKW